MELTKTPGMLVTTSVVLRKTSCYEMGAFMAGNFTLLRLFYICDFKYFGRFLTSYQKRKMPSNVEIKAKVQDYDKFRSLAEKISREKGTNVLI